MPQLRGTVYHLGLPTCGSPNVDPWPEIQKLGQGCAKLSHAVHRRRQCLSQRAAARDETRQFSVDKLEFRNNSWLTKCPYEFLSVSS